MRKKNWKKGRRPIEWISVLVKDLFILFRIQLLFLYLCFEVMQSFIYHIWCEVCFKVLESGSSKVKIDFSQIRNIYKHVE